jgi:hypothetical protein
VSAMPLLPILSLLWGNPWARLAAAAVLAFGFGFVKGFQSVPSVDVAAIERNAVLGRDAEWERKLAEANKRYDEDLTAAVEARNSTPPIVSDVELERLCQSSSTCRDKGRKR